MHNLKTKRACSTLLFGGTFDPPHWGHLQAIQYTLENVDIKKVYIVPAFDPPHKKESEVSPFSIRLELTRLLFSELKTAQNIDVVVSDIESKLEAPSFTYRTVVALKKQEGDDICVLVGRDMYDSLDSWEKPDTLRKSCHFIVLNRNISNLSKSKSLLLDKDKSNELDLGIYKNRDNTLEPPKELLNNKSKNIFLDNPNWSLASKDLRSMLSEYQSENSESNPMLNPILNSVSNSEASPVANQEANKKENNETSNDYLKREILKLIPQSVFVYIIKNGLYRNR